MEYFVLIVSAISIGLIVRYSLPQREAYGMLLAPAVALAACLLVWAAGLLFGLNADHFVLWMVSLLAAAIVPFLLVKILPAKRIAAQKAFLESLLKH
ncbi:MAG: hypothetical protein WBA28_02035 [Microbacteriaceae bacterium]